MNTASESIIIALSTGDGPSHEEIAKRAYELSETEGHHGSRDIENWLAAEAQLAAPQSAGTTERL